MNPVCQVVACEFREHEPLHVNAPRIVVVGLLEFDKMAGAPPYEIQRFLECGNRSVFEIFTSPGTSLEFFYLSEREVVYVPVFFARLVTGAATAGGKYFLDVRRALECFIVKDDKLLVFGNLQIVLDKICAHIERELEGGEGVFGSVSRCAAMSDDCLGRWSAG